MLSLLGAYPAPGGRGPEFAGRLVLAEMPPTALEELCQQIGAVTPAQVLNLLKAELRSDAEVVVAVGRLDKVERMYAGA